MSRGEVNNREVIRLPRVANGAAAARRLRPERKGIGRRRRRRGRVLVLAASGDDWYGERCTAVRDNWFAFDLSRLPARTRASSTTLSASSAPSVVFFIIIIIIISFLHRSEPVHAAAQRRIVVLFYFDTHTHNII